MANNDTSDILSEAPTEPIVPSDLAPTRFAQDTNSQGYPDDPIHVPSNDKDDAWDGFPWHRYEAWKKPIHTKREYTSWIWREGYRLQNIKSQTMIWVCKHCIKIKRYPAQQYEATSGTKKPMDHLVEKHSISKDGPILKRKLEEFMKPNESPTQAFYNRRTEGFNPKLFKRSFMRWMAYSNLSYRQIETEPFKRMMNDANPDIEKAGCLPCATTMKTWTANDFKLYMKTAAGVLQAIPYRLHFTFDLWTAGNGLSLNGIFAHWLDQHGQKRKMLLSLPEIDDRHTGENIAVGVAQIIREFNLQ
jgi:hypothetical protein